jgi:urease accessory protein UreH
MAFIFMQQSGDGLVQGDRNRIEISCGPGSATYITTQAATDGEYDVIAALHIIAIAGDLEKPSSACTGAGCPGVLAGIHGLPNASGIGLRLLGATSLKVEAALTTAWTAGSSRTSRGAATEPP